ncbi:sensor histidine kinase [Actinoalloteichus hymeniacidonis]|uniref:histidine kinase n=1 Tax=Actinoalloteichus hymeniacidonis TaxID=340345 RepID=A0AAC9MWK2_9PSEU|nr:HAMP domain-containing sensor histidine kinase [Actinoalloteichus hymeniacidonis]AOS61380.1 signal transduction histidine kinase [Actinoalloteichus hymeniacidonis]MBB5910615.1 two-component system sensor histidine kinase VanS [Actinoalloteichus hymeniacidonis]
MFEATAPMTRLPTAADEQGGSDQEGAQRRQPRRPRFTVRVRLTITYTGFLLLLGVAMVIGIYSFMRFVPNYAIARADHASESGDWAEISPEGFPQRVTEPIEETSGPTSPAETMDAVNLTIYDRDDVLNTLLAVSIGTLLVLGIAGAWVSWVVAGRVLRPLQQINAAAQRAGAGSLDHRVGLRGPDDEFKDLSDTFDSMLERLDRSFRAQQRFAADASHELRTPLATSKAMLDVAAGGIDDHDVPGLIARLQFTNRRSIETVESLLDLAEIGGNPLATAQVDFDDVLHKALADAGGEAAESGVTVISRIEKSSAAGDAVLLRQLAVNLLYNAVRHNKANGSITVESGPAGGGSAGAWLRVSNTGAVIAPETLTMLTEPFFRGAGRSADRSGRRGHGLGLALITAIVEAHRGSLELTANSGGGLTAMVRIPGYGTEKERS